MFKTIVWATDGSEAADQALPYLRQLAATSDTRVVVCHSVLAMLGPGGHGMPVYADQEEVEAKIKRQVDELVADGIAASLRIVGGDNLHGAAYDIRRVADEEGADLVVAGTRGHTALGGLLLGSVTQRLLRVTGCPVLVVPAHAHDETGVSGSQPELAHV